MRWANLSLSRSRISAALSMRCARTANGVLRPCRKTSTARCSFLSISASESGGKVLITSPVAGLMVAMAIMANPFGASKSTRKNEILPPEEGRPRVKPSGHTTIPPATGYRHTLAAYNDFFTLWKDADPDVPNARSEWNYANCCKQLRCTRRRAPFRQPRLHLQSGQTYSELGLTEARGKIISLHVDFVVARSM